MRFFRFYSLKNATYENKTKQTTTTKQTNKEEEEEEEEEEGFCA